MNAIDLNDEIQLFQMYKLLETIRDINEIWRLGKPYYDALNNLVCIQLYDINGLPDNTQLLMCVDVEGNMFYSLKATFNKFKDLMNHLVPDEE